MKPRSLIGPLILITAGVLFLLNNLRPDWPLLDLLSRTWPYVLIGWGALRILELLIWRVQGKPLPTSGLSGGEWAFIIFLSLVGSGFFFVNRHAPWERLGRITVGGVEMFGEAFDFPVAEQALECGKAPRIVIENLRGNVRVVGSEEEKVTVSGRMTIRSLKREEADRAHASAPLELTRQGDQVFLRTNQERVTGESRISCDLEIRAPRGASITTRGRRGDVELVDLSGELDVTSDNAGVRVQNAGGNVRVNLRASDIVRVAGAKGNVSIDGSGRDIEVESIAGTVTVSGSYSGDLTLRKIEKPVRFQSRNTELQVQALPGEVRFDLGDFRAVNLVGPIRLKTRSKDVHFEDFSSRLELEVDRGDVEIRPRRSIVPEIDVKVRSGDIELALAPSARFQLSARTERGEVTNGFGDLVKVESAGRGAKMTTELRNGPKVALETNRGNVTVTTESVSRGETPRGEVPPGEGPPPPRAPKPPKPPVVSETF